MVGERPPPDNFQAGWWYSGFAGEGIGLRGPNNGLTLGDVPFFSDPCNLTGVMFGPGDLRNPCDRYHLWSLHTGGAHFLFADGSVHFLTYAAAPLMIPLASRAAGDIVPDF
jgi:prepilin-type processing-associated H-X9-DG protein